MAALQLRELRKMACYYTGVDVLRGGQGGEAMKERGTVKWCRVGKRVSVWVGR